MKITLLIVAAWGTLLLGACNHTIVCRPTNTIAYFLIKDHDTASQYVRVVRYEAGSNFTKPVDSTEEIKNMTFPLTVEQGKDYAILVLPQNRRHTLTKISFGKDKRKGSPGLDSEQCTSSITFTLDGSVKKQPMAVGGSGGYLYMEI